MITISETPKRKQKGFEFSFQGLSTDEKPIGKYEELKIGNGSSFLELDTKEIYFYDQENQAWV